MTLHGSWQGKCSRKRRTENRAAARLVAATAASKAAPRRGLAAPAPPGLAAPAPPGLAAPPSPGLAAPSSPGLAAPSSPGLAAPPSPGLATSPEYDPFEEVPDIELQTDGHFDSDVTSNQPAVLNVEVRSIHVQQ